MANRAYINIWTSSYSEDVMLDRFERLLETVPLSPKRPGFTSLEIRAVTSAEAALVEQDLRGVLAGAADVIALTREHRNADSSYEVQGYWDVWQCDAASGLWQREAQRLLLICNGQDYDDGVAADAGHFMADIGLEHLFTGHGGLLGSNGAFPQQAPQHPAEAQFLALMTQEESLLEYHEKTRENVRQLLAWVRALEGALPVERYRMWSEGEENLEARLDDILAVR